MTRCDHNLDQRSAPGFVPKGEVRQPGADASPAWVARSRISSQAVRPTSRWPLCTTVHKGRPRRLTRARVSRRMGEGLGAGGHSTRRWRFNAQAGRRFLSVELFSGRPRGGAAAARAHPMRQVHWQFHMPAVGKLEISQMDAKTSSASAAALHHVTGADWEPAGEICERSHHNPPRKQQPSWNLPASMPDERDSSETAAAPGTDFCESLWTSTPPLVCPRSLPRNSGRGPFPTPSPHRK
jgi:hypothetical protein